MDFSIMSFLIWINCYKFNQTELSISFYRREHWVYFLNFSTFKNISLFPLFMHDKKLGCKNFGSHTFLPQILETLLQHLLDLRVAERFEVSLILLFQLYLVASSSWQKIQVVLHPTVYSQCRQLSWNMVRFFFKMVILYLRQVVLFFFYAICCILINRSGLCFLRSMTTIFSLTFHNFHLFLKLLEWGQGKEVGGRNNVHMFLACPRKEGLAFPHVNSVHCL